MNKTELYVYLGILYFAVALVTSLVFSVIRAKAIKKNPKMGNREREGYDGLVTFLPVFWITFLPFMAVIAFFDFIKKLGEKLVSDS